MSLDHPAALPPPVTDAWESLADGLITQRLHLHLPDIQTALGLGTAECLLPAGAHPAALLARPVPLPGAARPLVEAAGLRAWTVLPQRFGGPAQASTPPLAATGHELAVLLAAGCGTPVEEAVTAVCDAAVWWTGAFAAIRHTGGHHRTLADVTAPVSLEVLNRTARLLALGAAARVLRRSLQHRGDGDDALRNAFCRAVTEAIVAEPGIPALVEDLGELRLADLVVNALPWRGRHTAYRSGLGSGQVE
ncbi:hypothetical protein [Streptomyces sp. NPDC001787]|uniref:hypothetical protein n=1 Tax=Streptomyces sp. NPDC001787 TaxID=3154523 RepID=UPI003324CC46